VLFFGKVAIASSPWVGFKTEWTKLLPIVGGTALISLFVASIALLLASLASRRGYATASVIAFFLVLPPVVDMFRSVMSGDLKRYTLLIHPVYLIMGFANWLFDIEAKRHTEVGRADLPGSVYMLTLMIACIVCIALFLRRYRRMEA
jgi:ABC-2 type transport system permease protein